MNRKEATLQGPTAACLIVSPERVLLDNQTYSVDSRPVVVPATKGRVMRHRPRFDSWELEFEVTWDPDLRPSTMPASGWDFWTSDPRKWGRSGGSW